MNLATTPNSPPFASASQGLGLDLNSGSSSVTNPLLDTLGLGSLTQSLPLVGPLTQSLNLGGLLDSLPVAGPLVGSLGLDHLLGVSHPQGQGQSNGPLLANVKSLLAGLPTAGLTDPLLSALQSLPLPLLNGNGGNPGGLLSSLDPATLTALLTSLPATALQSTPLNGAASPLAALQGLGLGGGVPSPLAPLQGLNPSQLTHLLSGLPLTGHLTKAVPSLASPLGGLDPQALQSLLGQLQATAGGATTNPTAALQGLLDTLGQSLPVPLPVAQDPSAVLAQIMQQIQANGGALPFAFDKKVPAADALPSTSASAIPTGTDIPAAAAIPSGTVNPNMVTDLPPAPSSSATASLNALLASFALPQPTESLAITPLSTSLTPELMATLVSGPAAMQPTAPLAAPLETQIASASVRAPILDRRSHLAYDPRDYELFDILD